MGTTGSIGASSFYNVVENTLDGDQIFDKARHAYTFWKGILKHYLMKK